LMDATLPVVMRRTWVWPWRRFAAAVKCLDMRMRRWSVCVPRAGTDRR
jgi:hypothetical protein